MDPVHPIIADKDQGSVAAEFASAIASEKIAKGSKLNLPLPLGKMTRLSALDELVEQCGKTAKAHGFWDAHVNAALKLFDLDRQTYDDIKALGGDDIDSVHGKVKLPAAHLYVYRAIAKLEKAELLGDPAIFLALILTEGAEAIEAARNKNWSEPSGVWEELADCFIRQFDFIARYGEKHGMTASRFLAMIQGKMAVNEARPPLHGKSY
jgi:hypothetical protein